MLPFMDELGIISRPENIPLIRVAGSLEFLPVTSDKIAYITADNARKAGNNPIIAENKDAVLISASYINNLKVLSIKGSFPTIISMNAGPGIQVIETLDAQGMLLGNVLSGFFNLFNCGLITPKIFIIDKLLCLNDLNVEQSRLLGVKQGDLIHLDKVMFSNNYPISDLPAIERTFMFRFIVNDRLFGVTVSAKKVEENLPLFDVQREHNKKVIEIKNLKEDTTYQFQHKRYIDTKIKK